MRRLGQLTWYGRFPPYNSYSPSLQLPAAALGVLVGDGSRRAIFMLMSARMLRPHLAPARAFIR